ncbi:hypothetical protein JCM8097_009167 [Rhodosporidiobolus ruineniae]
MPPASDRAHQLVRQRLQNSFGAHDHGFASGQAQLVRLGDVHLQGVELDGEDDTKPTRGAQAVVECFLTVDDTCCNPSSNAHGGFLAWLVDHCSSLSLLALSGPGEKWVTSGVSTHLQLFYIGAAPVGTTLKITSKVLQHGRVTGLLEVRIEDADTEKLVAFATHTKQDPQRRAKL